MDVYGNFKRTRSIHPLILIWIDRGNDEFLFSIVNESYCLKHAISNECLAVSSLTMTFFMLVVTSGLFIYFNNQFLKHLKYFRIKRLLLRNDNGIYVSQLFVHYSFTHNIKTAEYTHQASVRQIFPSFVTTSNRVDLILILIFIWYFIDTRITCVRRYHLSSTHFCYQLDNILHDKTQHDCHATVNTEHRHYNIQSFFPNCNRVGTRCRCTFRKIILIDGLNQTTDLIHQNR